jgi:hypothetical protein
MDPMVFQFSFQKESQEAKENCPDPRNDHEQIPKILALGDPPNYRTDDNEVQDKYTAHIPRNANQGH